MCVLVFVNEHIALDVLENAPEWRRASIGTATCPGTVFPPSPPAAAASIATLSTSPDYWSMRAGRARDTPRLGAAR